MAVKKNGAKYFGSEGPKRSTKRNPRVGKIRMAEPPKKRNSNVTALPGNKLTAQAIRNAVNLLSRLPGGNEAANANLRKSVNRSYGMNKAEDAAKAGTQRSRMAVDRAKSQANKKVRTTRADKLIASKRVAQGPRRGRALTAKQATINEQSRKR